MSPAHETGAAPAAALATVEIKAFVPARDFAQSQQFYRDLGFTLASVGGGVAYLHHGGRAFLLQDFYVEALATNLQMHLQVEDVRAWRAHVGVLDLPGRHGVRAPTELVEQPWGMIDFCLFDPSGVLWRVGQNTPGFTPVGRVDAP